MKALTKICLALFTAIATFSSCSSDEEQMDLRNRVAGEYAYTKTTYTNTGIYTETGTMNILSDGENSGRLIVKEEATFYGSTVNAIDSSLVFFIPQQFLVDSNGNRFAIKGIDNVNIGDWKGDAGYFPDKNRLQLYYKAQFNEDPKLDYSVTILAERK